MALPRSDRRALSLALRRLNEDGSAARRMGIAGHARVRDHFSVETMVESYDAIFQALLEKEAAGRAARRSTWHRERATAGVESD